MPAVVNFITPALGPNIIEEVNTGFDENETDVLEIFSEWKDWLLAAAGTRLGLPQAFTVIGGEQKTALTNLGQAFFLHPEWKLRPANYNHRWIINGDIQVLGGTGRLTVPTVGGFTVEVSLNTSTLITGLNLSNPLSATQTAAAVWDAADSSYVAAGSKGRSLGLLSYQDVNAIFLSSNGSAGSVFPTNGSPTNPVNNLADALTLLSNTGFAKLVILSGSYSLTSPLLESTVQLHGDSQLNFGSQNVGGSVFEGGVLTGSMSGTISVRGAHINNVTNFKGTAHWCGLSGTTSLAAGHSTFERCHSREQGLGTAVIDLQQTSTSVNLQAFAGGIELRNMVDATNIVDANFVSGYVVLASSCVSPAIAVIRGTADLLNSGTIVPSVDGLVTGRQLQQMHRFRGLDPNNDFVAVEASGGSPGSHTAGGKTITITESPAGTFTTHTTDP